MSRECEICGKTKMNGNKIKRDGQGILGRNSYQRQPNLQTVTVTEENGSTCKKRVCTRCLKKMKNA
ncbi:MAG: 50S ribosomal protein L28 [Clostridia bacterium]|nr:50S ribosomal protein L28 [Clostridia bacterium]